MRLNWRRNLARIDQKIPLKPLSIFSQYNQQMCTLHIVTCHMSPLANGIVIYWQAGDFISPAAKASIPYGMSYGFQGKKVHDKRRCKRMWNDGYYVWNFKMFCKFFHPLYIGLHINKLKLKKIMKTEGAKYKYKYTKLCLMDFLDCWLYTAMQNCVRHLTKGKFKYFFRLFWLCSFVFGLNFVIIGVG